MPLFACHSRVDIPRDLVNYKRKDLERKYVRIATDYSHESSRASCQILLNECSIPNTKTLITLGYYGLLNPQLTVLNKTNLLQMFLTMAKVRDYNSLLVYKSGVLRTLFKYAMVLKTGRRFCFNKKIPQTEVIRFSEYVVHVLEEFANYNSFDALILDGVPPGVKKLCEEAKSLKAKLIKKGVKFTMDSWETPYHRNVSMNTMGGSDDMVLVKTFPEKLRELQDDLNGVEVQMTQLGLFERDGQAEESVISDLISSLSLYEYRAQNLIQESVDAEQMEHYDDTVNLLDYIKHLINLLKTKICISLDPNYIETHLSEAQEFEQFVTMSSAEEHHESNVDESNIEINLENQEIDEQLEQSDASTEFFDSASDEEEVKDSENRDEDDRRKDSRDSEREDEEKVDRRETEEREYDRYEERKSVEQLSPVRLEDMEEKLDLIDTYKLLDYQDSPDNTKSNLDRSLLSTVDELVSLRSEREDNRDRNEDTDYSERVEQVEEQNRMTRQDGKHVVFENVVEEEYEEEDEDTEVVDSEEEVEVVVESEYEEESDEASEERDSDEEEVVDEDTDDREYYEEFRKLEEEIEDDVDEDVEIMYTKEDYLDGELVEEDEDDTFSDKKDLYLFEKEYSESSKLEQKISSEILREQELVDRDIVHRENREDAEVVDSENRDEDDRRDREEVEREKIDEEKLFWSTEDRDSSEKTSLFSVMSRSKSLSLEVLVEEVKNREREKIVVEDDRETKEKEEKVEEKQEKERKEEKVKFKDVKEMVKKLEKKEKEVVVEDDRVDREVEEKKDTERKEEKVVKDMETKIEGEDKVVKEELVLPVKKDVESINELYNDMSYVMDTLRRINNYLESKPPRFVANSKNYQNLQLSSYRSLSFDRINSQERVDRREEEIDRHIEDKDRRERLEKERKEKMSTQGSLESVNEQDVSMRLSRDELQLRKIENELQLELGEQFLEKERQLKQQLFGNIDDNLFKRISNIYLPKKNLPMTSTVLPYDNSFVTSSIASSNHPQYNITNNYYSTTHSPRNYYNTTNTSNTTTSTTNTTNTIHAHGPTNYYSTGGTHSHSHTHGPSNNHYSTTSSYPDNYHTSSSTHNYYYSYDDSSIQQMNENERSDGKGIHREINKNFVVFKKGIPSDNLRNRLLTNYERTEYRVYREEGEKIETERKDNGNRRGLEYDRDQEFNTNNSIVLEPSSELKQLNKLTKLLSLDVASDNEEERVDSREVVDKKERKEEKENIEKQEKERKLETRDRESEREDEERVDRREIEEEYRKNEKVVVEDDRKTGERKGKTYKEERSTDENGYPVIDLSEFENLEEESEMGRGRSEELRDELESLERSEYRESREGESREDSNRDSEREEMESREKKYRETRQDREEEREERENRKERRKGNRLERRGGDRDVEMKDTDYSEREREEDSDRERERKQIRKSRETKEKKERKYREYTYPQEVYHTHHYYKRSVHHYTPHSPNRYDYYDSRYQDRDREEDERGYKYRVREYPDRYYDEEDREYYREDDRNTREYREYRDRRERRRKDREYERREIDDREYDGYDDRREYRDRYYPDRYYEDNYRTPVREGYPVNESYYVVEPNSSNEAMNREYRNRRDREYRDRRVVEVNDTNSSLSGRNMEYERDEVERREKKYREDKEYKEMTHREEDDRRVDSKDRDVEMKDTEREYKEHDPNLTPRTTFRTTFRSESVTSNRTEEDRKTRESREEEKVERKEIEKERYEERKYRESEEREYDRYENVDNMMVTNSNVVKNVIKCGGDVIFEDKMMTIRFTQSPVYHPGNSSYMQTEHNYTLSTENVLTIENNSLFSYSLSFDYSNFENFPLDIKFLNKKFTGVELVPGQKMSHRFSAHCFGPFVGLPKLNLTAHIDVQTDRVFQVYLPLAVSCFFTPSMDMFRLSKSYFNSDKFKHIMRNKVYFNAPKRMSLGQVMEIVTGFGKFKLLQQAESCYYLASSFSAPFYFGTKELYRFTIFAMVEVSTTHYHVHVSSDSYRLANSTSMLLKYILQN